MSNEPIHHTMDPYRRAKTIRCEVCHTCRWADPMRIARCVYGGPYDGYQTLNGDTYGAEYYNGDVDRG